MQTLIYLLIGLLLGVILNNYFGTIREGQGPMVGSIMFPTMYQGKTDVTHKPIEVREKQDVKTMVKTQLTNGSWPFRVIPEDGKVWDSYGSGIVHAIEFLENMIRYLEILRIVLEHLEFFQIILFHQMILIRGL